MATDGAGNEVQITESLIDQKDVSKTKEEEKKNTENKQHEPSSSASSSGGSPADRLDLPLPPDGGYGWVIVFVCFLCAAIVEGSIASFGIFLPHFVSYFGTSQAKTTLAGSFLIGGIFSSGPVVSIIINAVGCRYTTMCGATLTVLAFVLSILSPNIIVFTFLYGFLGGFGLGMIYLPSMVMVGYYFERRRSLATGIAYSGAGFGLVIMAPITALLLREFDWKNSLIYFSLFVAQCAVLGALMRPFNYFNQVTENSMSSQDDIQNQNEKVSADTQPMLTKHDILDHGEKFNGSVQSFSTRIKSQKHDFNASLSHSVDGIKTQSLHGLPNIRMQNQTLSDKKNDIYTYHTPSHVTQSSVDLPLDTNKRKKALRGHQERNTTRGSQKHFISVQEIASLPDEVLTQIDLKRLREELTKPLARRDVFYSGSIKQLQEYKEQPDLQSYIASVTMVPCDDMDKPAHYACCRCVSKSTVATFKDMLHLELLINPYFFIICFASILIQLGYFVPIVFLPEFAVHHGVDESQASLLISVIGLSNAVGRAGAGALGTLSQVNALHLNNVSLFIAGITTILVTFFPTFPALVFYAIVFGTFIGSFVPLTTLFLVQYLGLHRLNNAMGLLSLIRGLSSSMGPPIAGLLLDQYSNHNPVFYFAGSMITLAGATFYAINLYEKIKGKRKRTVV